GMRRILRFFAVLGMVGVTAPALAQVQTGSILTRATDEQGAIMPGVAITISSPVLVAGTMTAVTDAGGVYRFPSLTPGTYSVKLELSGFQTINRENIVVLVGQTTPVEFTMKVASLAENVTVTGASPTVDTTSANVNVNLSEELIQGTPGGCDIWAVVEYKVPSLTITRPDVGGTSGGLQGTYSARGTTSAQNSQYLNGINVGDPSAIGAAGYYYDFDAFSDVNFSLGGPIVTNKLRAFGSLRDWRVHVNVPAAFSTTVLDQTNIDSGLVNVTYQMNTNNKLTGFFSRQRYNKPNRFLQSPT